MNTEVKIRHHIPGRLRLSAKKNNAINVIKTKTLNLEGFLSARHNPACLSLVINYDPNLMRPRELLSSIEAIAAECLGEFCPITSKNSDSYWLNLKQRLVHSAVLSLASLVFFIREKVFKLPISEAPLSAAGLIVWGGSWPLLKKAVAELKKKRFTLEAFLAGGCLMAVIAGQSKAALEILWIHSCAESLKAWISERSRRSIAKMLELSSKNVFVMVDGVEIQKPVSEIKAGDILVLHTGEKIPADGELISGEALIDDSPLTGRAIPASLNPGDAVFAGCFVRQGMIQVQVNRVGGATNLARVMRQVEEVIDNRAPIESEADQLAKNMVKLGIVSTAATLIMTGSLWRAFTVLLVMACPCATSLAAQTAVSAAISSAARRGLLIKGGRYLEDIGRAEVICFDKTGTLTTNYPYLEKIINYSYFTEEQIISWAASAETHNHHPLAMAIKKEAEEKGVEAAVHTLCDFSPGKGILAEINGDKIRIGSKRYLHEAGLDTRMIEGDLLNLLKEGFTTVLLAKNTQIVAALAFANELRPEAESIIQQLPTLGLERICMITGDEENTALDLCARLGIRECRHSVLPEEKGAIIRSIREKNQKVIMVGDGINDALALAEADIGVAVSAAGSDVAIEAADIVLVNDSLADLIYLRSLSCRTMRIIKQNFWLAAGSNVAGALAAALGILSPVAAGALHITHTLGVLANSSRLLISKDKKITNG